jgi:aerotaxis receptor
MRNGQVTGDMSVRTRPARHEVQQAEDLYRRLRGHKAGSLGVHKGLVVHGGWSSWRSPPC